MKKLTKEDIEYINAHVKDSWYEGVFVQPTYIPVHIKEPVIYMRWNSGGYSGGSCYDEPEDEGATPYENYKPTFTVLDQVLEKLEIVVTPSLLNSILNLIHTNEETEYEYYGNSTDWKVEYIKLSELYALLQKTKTKN